ncbi:hypothetical protein R1sor_018340 [Riccia sorocarpa]|uniref:Uncharacterized protein n=1 Tax=Riccia sorocarpa TaxID=122646 RepID=A0ABD3I9F4_9MARC
MRASNKRQDKVLISYYCGKAPYGGCVHCKCSEAVSLVENLPDIQRSTAVMGDQVPLTFSVVAVTKV